MSSRLVRAKIFDAVAVASTGNAVSTSIPLEWVERVEAVVLKAISASAVADVKIEYAGSPDDTNYESYDDTDDITSSTLLENANTPEAFNSYAVPAILNRYIKFKVTGVASNPADTLVTGYALLRELL